MFAQGPQREKDSDAWGPGATADTEQNTEDDSWAGFSSEKHTKSREMHIKGHGGAEDSLSDLCCRSWRRLILKQEVDRVTKDNHKHPPSSSSYHPADGGVNESGRGGVDAWVHVSCWVKRIQPQNIHPSIHPSVCSVVTLTSSHRDETSPGCLSSIHSWCLQSGIFALLVSPNSGDWRLNQSEWLVDAVQFFLFNVICQT